MMEFTEESLQRFLKRANELVELEKQGKLKPMTIEEEIIDDIEHGYPPDINEDERYEAGEMFVDDEDEKNHEDWGNGK